MRLSPLRFSQLAQAPAPSGPAAEALAWLAARGWSPEEASASGASALSPAGERWVFEGSSDDGEAELCLRFGAGELLRVCLADEPFALDSQGPRAACLALRLQQGFRRKRGTSLTSSVLEALFPPLDPHGAASSPADEPESGPGIDLTPPEPAPPCGSVSPCFSDDGLECLSISVPTGPRVLASLAAHQLGIASDPCVVRIYAHPGAGGRAGFPPPGPPKPLEWVLQSVTHGAPAEEAAEKIRRFLRAPWARCCVCFAPLAPLPHRRARPCSRELCRFALMGGSPLSGPAVGPLFRFPSGPLAADVAFAALAAGSEHYEPFPFWLLQNPEPARGPSGILTGGAVYR